MSGFDLVAEPWATMVVAGQPVEVSLADALTRAHEIDGFALDDPLEAVAMLRQVLLPVVLHALGPPKSEGEWAKLWAAGRLDAGRIGEYLDERADRFDLFHPERPFAQVAGLRTGKNEVKPVSLLLPAFATGNNVPLFTARTEAQPPALTPAAAARAVLVAQCWDTAAIKSGAFGDPLVSGGKTTGNPTGPVGQLGVTVPMGRTLAETLIMNMPILPQGLTLADRPQWDNPEPWSPRWDPAGRPRGLLDLLTWQARRIRLVRDDDGLVRWVVLAAGDRLAITPHDMEPHTAWRYDEKATAHRPVRHQPGKAAWRGMASLLATRPEEPRGTTGAIVMAQLGDLRAADLVPADVRLRVLTVGVVYGNQSAVVEDVLADLIPLPIAALPADDPIRELLLQTVNEAEKLREAANWLGDDLRKAVGAEKLPWDKGLRLGEALVHDFTDPVRRLLGGLQREPNRMNDAESAWRQSARRLALAALDRAMDALAPEAFLGRTESEKVQHRAANAEALFRARVNDTLSLTGGRP